MNKLSLELNNYTEEEINSFALKFINSKNSAIDYYHSEKGKERYRAGSRKYYHNNREKCLKIAKDRYAKMLKKQGKIVQPRRGRPRKIPLQE